MLQENPFDPKLERYSYEVYEILSERFKGKLYAGYQESLTFNPEPKTDPYSPERSLPIIHVTLRPQARDARCVAYYPQRTTPEVYNIIPLVGEPESALKDADRIGDYFALICDQRSK